MARWGAILIAFAIGLRLGTPAADAQSVETWRCPLTDAQLGAIRAGYLSLDGVTFEFAVTLQTFSAGQLVLASTLSVGGAPVQAGGASPVVAAPTSGGSTQIVIPSGSTSTTLIQTIGAGGVQNIIATNASNQQFSQNTNLTLQLAGFQQNQSQYLSQHLVSALSSQLAFSTAVLH
jgi:hypothetical protein